MHKKLELLLYAFIIKEFSYLSCFTEIVNQVRQVPSPGQESFRPDLELLRDGNVECPEYILSCMQDCWAENPDMRPDFVAIRSRLKKMKEGM